MSEIVPNFLTGGTALFAVPLVDAAFAGGGPLWMLNCEFSPAAYGSSWMVMLEQRPILASSSTYREQCNEIQAEKRDERREDILQ